MANAVRAVALSALALLALLPSGGNALAQDCSVADQLITTPPPGADGGPVTIEVGVFLIDLVSITGADETFSVDFVLVSGWRDPRLSAAVRGTSMEECRPQLSEIWNPLILPVNQRGISREPIGRARVDSEGYVTFRERIFGGFSAVLDLQEFPFDRQRLSTRFVSAEYGPDVVDFVANEAWAGRLDDADLAGWTVLSNESDADRPPMRGPLGERAGFDHWISVERQPSYFLWQMVLPLSFIVLMAWAVFWIDPEAYATQSR